MYHIDWEGAYDAWKKSGLSQQKFQYSQHFKCFIGQEGVPSAETIRIWFRRIRDQRGDHYVSYKKHAARSSPSALNPTSTVEIYCLDEQMLQDAIGEFDLNRDGATSLRQVVVRMPSGCSVEFESQNAELFALKVLGCLE